MIVINAEKPIPPKEVKPVERAFKEKFQFRNDEFNGVIIGKPNFPDDYYGEFQSSKSYIYGGKSVIGSMGVYNNWEDFRRNGIPNILLKGKNSSNNKQVLTKTRFYMNHLIEDTTIKRIRFTGNIYSSNYHLDDIRFTFKLLNGNVSVLEKSISVPYSGAFDIYSNGTYTLKKDDPIFFELHYEYMANYEQSGSGSNVPYLQEFKIELYP